MHGDDFGNRLDTVFARFRFIEQRITRSFRIIADSAMRPTTIFIECSLDLAPSGIQQVAKRRFILAGIDGMQALLADDLSNQLGGIRHNLVAKSNPGTTGPDVLGELPLYYFVDEV